jgi:glycosyltransferase involved in cell wall biosynthesis
VHYIGVDTDALAPDATAREPIVVFVGRLIPNKGAELLIAAMRDVRRRVPAARLVIVGDGPLRGELPAAPWCELTGALPHTEAIRWMRRATVFCVPSVAQADGSSEGFGLVFAEAQAVGTPVVSFATGGIPEVVADGETGLLAPPRDVAALADRIATMLGATERWHAWSAAARRRVCERFDLRTQNRALETIYDDVVREAGTASK